MLMRLARYLKGARRVKMKYEDIQDYDAKFIDVYTDSDWAKCQITRKSTSAGMLCVGQGVIKSWSKTQTSSLICRRMVFRLE